ncbi:hypothetical protein PG995_013889 [Apiospora arundinis]
MGAEEECDYLRILLDEPLETLIGVEEEHRDDIRSQLDEHVERLKSLIGVETIASEQDSADHLMRRVAEDCEKKRLFICCDGTRNNASGTVDPLTNVAKFARAIYRTGEDKYKVPTREAVEEYYGKTNEEKRFGNVRQMVYYSSGVGTRSALGTDSLYASAVGKGLSANILDAYCFICNNYNNRSFLDEIILVGFSRGLLLPDKESSKDQWPESYQKLQETLEALKTFITGPDGDTPIRVLAEWDTVSAVGIWESHLSFVGATVPKNVENAFHAVSIHEKRKKFQPMMWKSLYAVPYWILGRLWDGTRDFHWEEFLKQDDHVKDGQVINDHVEDEPVRDGVDDGITDPDRTKQPYVNLTIHSTVRLLHKNRYKKCETQTRDPRLRCGLFEDFDPIQINEQWRWVKRDKPTQYLEEEAMTGDEKWHFNRLLKQAKRIHGMNPGECWTTTEQLLDDNGHDWNEVNENLKWGPILKGCVYDQTFISLLKDELGGLPNRKAKTDGSDDLGVSESGSGDNTDKVADDNEDNPNNAESNEWDDVDELSDAGRRKSRNESCYNE